MEPEEATEVKSLEVSELVEEGPEITAPEPLPYQVHDPDLADG